MKISQSSFRRHLGTLAAVLIVAIAAGETPGAIAQGADPPGEARGTISGRVVDAVTRQPIAGVVVRFPGLGRSDLTGSDGSFELRGVPAGSHTLTLQRVGYASAEAVAELTAAGGETLIEVALSPTALELGGIVVTASGAARRAEEVFQPVSVLGGAELRARLGASVAATIAGEPGISERYNGPAASQPVIRGLSGDRVLVLEDGNRSGDVATTSADHAVSIDPAGAERIEVVRGPAGLLYGSNALAGVINVIREDVPRSRPERITVRGSLQGESVNSGISGAANVRGAFGDVAWQAALSGRSAGDTRTPLGDLPSTEITGYGAGLGLAWVRPEGFLGAAVRDYAIGYGVPGTFQGAVIPGAHEDGVDIEMRRISGTGSGGWLAGWGPFSSVEADLTYSWYHHREIEHPGTVGTEFGQLSGSARVVARHRHEGDGLPREGALGLWSLARDFNVAGSHTGTRPAREYVVAVFGYEELAWDRARLQLGARYDRSRVVPDEVGITRIGEVRTRDFGALSGSVSAIVDLVGGLSLGATASRAFRTPSIEELFSDGPHLADFSYNIGNPDLRPEVGFGTDVFLRFSNPEARAELSVFRNRITDFIHYAPTGEMDPRLGQFPVYQASQTDALLVGGEGVLEWEVVPSLALRSALNYVRGTRGSESEPLPAIPPLSVSQTIRYERTGWFANATWRGAAAQDRVAENEPATDGYSLIDLGGGIRWIAADAFQSLTFSIGNVADTVWRDHLSRTRVVAPQPGRNVRITYHVEF